MKVQPYLIIALIGVSACSDARSPDTLVPKLEQLAEGGSGEAQYHLGMAYWVGEGVHQDREKALRYFRQAAAAGDPLGAYKLGCLYDSQGNILDRDLNKALQFKLVAAEAGYALAQQDVAALYAQRQEYGEALKWLQRAARQGTPDALLTYASVYNGADGVKPNPAITAAYFRLYLDRHGGTAEQRAWLSSFEHELSPAQREQAKQIRSQYRPAPTSLTLKALSGVEAAENLTRSR